jgi:uncharacterized RDD family membrane protein YckC
LNIEKQISGNPCGFFRRLAIIVYDFAIVISLLMLATMLAMLLGFGDLTAMKDPVYTAYLFSIWYCYLAWCWHRGGMTVGMRAWRVHIVDENGNRPGWGKSTIRFLASLASAAVAGIGFFWALADSRKRTWHDILSGTRLVKNQKESDSLLARLPGSRDWSD